MDKIFPNQGSSSGTVHKEILHRNEKERKNYQSWLSQQAHYGLVSAISQAYFYKKTQIISPIQIHLFRSNGAEGFAVKFEPSIGRENFQNLMDYFKDQVLKLNYRLQVSELKISDKGSYVETKQKYYLKPILANTPEHPLPLDQQYGNILIEHIAIDRQPGYLKFLVTYYQDRLFTVVKDYDELIGRLFAL